MEMSAALYPWPTVAPTHGNVTLRQFCTADAEMARELSGDPYISAIGTLPPHATASQAQLWVERQQNRYSEGAGFSFAVIDDAQGRCAGFVGLWVRELSEGRSKVGYGIAPSFRGRRLAADAVRAVTAFGWTIPTLHRTELYIEPWNTASIKTAEQAGYLREGLLRSHQEISGERRDMLLYSSLRNQNARTPTRP